VACLDLTLKVLNILIAGFISPCGVTVCQGVTLLPMSHFAQDIGLQSAGKEASRSIRDICLSVLFMRCYHITTLSPLNSCEQHVTRSQLNDVVSCISTLSRISLGSECRKVSPIQP